MISLRRGPWLSAGFTLLLTCTITAALMAGRPVRQIQVKAASSRNLSPLVSPQGNGYTYRRTITIDHTKVPNTDLSNFPVLLSGTYSYLATLANGGNVQSSNGYDVIFTSDSGCANKLEHEVETYNATTGAVNYWIKVPALSHTADTAFYLCYGNAGITTDQSNKTGVWDTNFKAVWHVPNGSTLNATDSTANHNLTNNSVAASAGQVDGGASFDGSTQYLSSTAHADFNWANLRTVEFWMKLGNTTQVLPRLFSYGDGSSDAWSIIWLDPPSVATSGLAGKSLAVSIGNQSTPSIQRRTPDNAIDAADVWHQVAVVGDGATVAAIYVDGSPVTVSNYTGNITNTTIAGLNIGRRNNDGRYFTGALDELRLSNAPRSADWVKTEYNNQSSPATFYSVSPTSTTFTYRRRITIDHTKVPNTDLSNFPVLVSGAYSYLATVANGGNVQSSNGYDVIFTSDCNCSAQLNHEVETYNASTGAVNYWVKVPTLSHTTDTVIYMCYGNAAISGSQQNTAGVWDTNFKAVWHVPNGSTLNATDSTATHNLTNNGVAATTGKVDGGSSFDGSTQYLSSAAHADFNWANLRSVEFWMRLGNTTQVLPRLFSYGDGSSDAWSIIWMDPPSVATSGLAGKSLAVSIGNQSTPSIQRRTPDNAINAADVWHQVAVIGDGSSVAAIYLDGDPVTVSNYTGNITNTTIAGLNIGRRNNDGRYFTGALDELRLSNAPRSADWIKTEYNNQNSPATFYSITSANVDCNQPPTANAGGPYSAESGETIQFEGVGSSDLDGYISSYHWEFGDGNNCTALASPLNGPPIDDTCTNAYSTPGTYTVTVTVTDNSGATSSASTTATIANRAPLANSGGPYSGAKQTTIQFQGSNSSDPDGSIVGYEWNFGDGSQGSGVSPTHSYTSTGNYTVSLTVTDNSGASSSGFTTATINTAPVAYAGDPLSGLSGLAVQLNGAGSTDADGNIATYQWNFGDGNSGSGATPTHVYSSTGTYTAQLTVTDSFGATGTASTSVLITSPSNQLPVANPQGPSSGVTGTPVQFSGSGSYDPDGSIAAYHWEFADGGTAESSSATHTFGSSGTHLVTLKVTDNGGATSWTSLNINIAGGGNTTNSSLDVSWDKDNRGSLDDPTNERGNQPNHVAGNNNFQITAPVLSLPGRGLDLTLGLIYNSLVWNKAGNEMAFDIDQDWPAPGWQLGFGKMVAMGTAGALLIEPDGTRHSFTGTVFNDIRPSPFPGQVLTFKGRTTDGSLIEYRCEGLDAGGPTEGIARYPNGMIVRYRNYSTDSSVPRAYLYPTNIRDANGNNLSITYLWDLREARIQRVVDTVGRVIVFHYDNQKRLTSITGPGLPNPNGTATIQTFVRLHYATKSVVTSGAFTSGATLRIRNSSPNVIDAIYYPATGTGYWFPADEAYSSYGMLKRVEQQRGMGFSAAANPDEQGTITPGTVTRVQDYDYPSAPTGLNAAPTFHNVVGTWDGAIAPTTTTFAVEENSTDHERTVTVTNPDLTKSIQVSFYYGNPPESDPNKFRDGAVKEQRIVDSSGHLISRTTFSWEKGVDNAARLQRVETTDERGNTSATDYDQYGSNNSLGRTRERDFNGSIIRTTINTYLSYVDNDIDLRLASVLFPNIFHPRVINLVESAKVFTGDDAGNVLASQTNYHYDEYATPLKAYAYDYDNTLDLTSLGVAQHLPISGVLCHNPYYNPLPATQGGNGADYFTKRGNITSITSYADTSNPSAPAVPITETRTYDMTGNVIASSRSCCEQTSSTFELPTQYAFPVSQSRGAADPTSLARVTTTATYDLNTGLRRSATDANGRTTQFSYYPDTLRLKEVVLPTGGRTNFEYDDVAMKVVHKTRLSENGAVITQTTKYVNGLGQLRREEALAPNNAIDIVETTYDAFGRPWKQSRPYHGSETPQWKETQYDSAGRVQKVIEPPMIPEGSPTPDQYLTATEYLYNENVNARPAGASTEPGQTTKITDAWGNWRWTRLDSRGQLAEVVEPNPDGGNGYSTRYTYDTLGNLIKIEQGDRLRRFRYDSLGRLTHQKLAERSATLNAAGEWDETTPVAERWSDVITYDQRSNVNTRVDARGVKTVFNYKVSGNDDPLNRLQSVSYDLTGVPSGLAVLPSATINYQYRTKNSASDLIDVTAVKQAEVVGVGTESYEYDSEGRVENKLFTFAGKSLPMTISFGYDSLNRIANNTYPEQYHDNASNPARKSLVEHHDAAGRIDGLKVNGVDYASQVTYNSASQMTSLLVGAGTTQLSENYEYHPASGLPMRQTVERGATTLVDLRYVYDKFVCPPNALCNPPDHQNAYTGKLKVAINFLGVQPKKYYTYDILGRLKYVHNYQLDPPPQGGLQVGGGEFSPPAGGGGWEEFPQDKVTWWQSYAYDQYGNRTQTTGGNPAGPSVPLDGVASLSYNSMNRITNAGYSYDSAGNQTTSGTGQSFLYDAAGRLVAIKSQEGATLATYTYGTSNHRVITQTDDGTSTNKTYYVWHGDSVIAEYVEQSSAAMPKWSKNYIYLGSRLLATEEPHGSGEIVYYHHPDRLGTRLITNNQDDTSFEQATMPFGTALEAESTGFTNQRFTSYDRSQTSGLDYAVNRHYDSRPGRFSQPDPLGMGAASLTDPQSLNMYSYAGNDPINRVDPDGQFWGALVNFIGGLFRNLKPNVINGSFAYGNHPPVSVSFTTNFQNIGVGYANIRVQLKSGVWLPKMLTAEMAGEGLTACNKSRLAPYFSGVNLDNIRIHFGFPTAQRLGGGVLKYLGIRALNGAQAITIGNDIYFRSTNVYNPDSTTGIRDIAHEITHVVQQRRPDYSFAKYVDEYSYLRKLGFDDDTAYRNTTDEKEAFKTGALVQKDLENLQKQLDTDNSPCPPRSP